MNNVIKLYPSQDAAECLREIAEKIDSGELENQATLIIGADVWHVGEVNEERAAEAAVFNMTLGIHKLMNPIFSTP